MAYVTDEAVQKLGIALQGFPGWNLHIAATVIFDQLRSHDGAPEHRRDGCAECIGLREALTDAHSLNAKLRLKNADLEGYSNVVANRARAEENERCAKICEQFNFAFTASIMRKSLGKIP